VAQRYDDEEEEARRLVPGILRMAGWDDIRRVEQSADCQGARKFAGAALQLRDALNAGKVHADSLSDVVALTRNWQQPWWPFVDPGLSGVDRSRRVVLTLWECDEHQLTLRDTVRGWVVVTANDGVHRELSDFEDEDDDDEQFIDASEPEVFELAADGDGLGDQPAPTLRRRRRSDRAVPLAAPQDPEEELAKDAATAQLASERARRIAAETQVADLKALLMLAETNAQRTQRVNEELARQRRDLESTVESLISTALEVERQESAERHSTERAASLLVGQLAAAATNSQISAIEIEMSGLRDSLVAAERKLLEISKQFDVDRMRLDEALQREQLAVKQRNALERTHEQFVASYGEVGSRVTQLESELAICRQDLALAEAAGRLIDEALERALPRRHREKVRKELRS